MLNKKHNFKSGRSQDKKRDLKVQTRQETKKGLMKKVANEYFDVPFMKQKQRRQKKRKRQKNKEPK